MNLLLDTHALLWALGDDPTLRPAAREAIADGTNRVLVSAISVWEVVIKRALGRLDAPDDLVAEVRRARFEPLAVTLEHAEGLAHLPDHHSDPFDRMLVTQARMERLVLVTRDAAIRRYDVQTLMA